MSRVAPMRFALCFTALLTTAPAVPAHADSRVTGVVVDGETQRPVAGADVELANAGGGQGYFRTRTDSKGEFTFARVPAERVYLFTVGADGFTEWALEGWQFPEAQRDIRLTVPLERAGELAVRATTSGAKAAVPGARVTVRAERGGSWWESRQRDPEPRFTDAEGTASFSGLRAGLYTVEVQAAGLKPQELRRVAVKQGAPTPVGLTLTRPSSLTGLVRLPDSSGVAGVTVIARGPSEATGTTDSQGGFTLTDLAPGRYRIEVAHDGFEPGAARDGVALAEGQSRDVGAIRATPRPAAFSFVLEREVFAAAVEPGDREAQRQQVGVRAFRVGALDLVLYRIPTSRLLDATRDFRGLTAAGADTAGLERTETWHFELQDGPPFAWREQLLPLPREQSPGAYLLVARSGRLERRQLFFVSDLSLVVKRSAAQTVAWAGALRTGVPVRDARVYAVEARTERSVSGGQSWPTPIAVADGAGSLTDADGLARLAATGVTQNLRIVAISERHGVAVAEAPLGGDATRDGQLFLFTERPLYRPGQTVYWKSIARRQQAERYAMPDRTQVRLTLSGPDGSSLELPIATLSATGTADGSVELPADAPLGDWTLSATAAGLSGSAPIGVQHYRKPEYQVQVTPDREVIVGGDPLRFSVAASYFFGAPVVGATVRWTLFESRLSRESDPFEDGWESGEGEGYGRMLESGETRTDVDGRVALGFTPPRSTHDRRLSLEVEVLDGAQRQVSARGSAIVGRGLFLLRVQPTARMSAAGQPIGVEVSAQDHTGKPVVAAVTVDLDQDVWNAAERRYVRGSRPLASLPVQTDAATGRARVSIAPQSARSGPLTLRARAQDARGNLITAESNVWLYDERSWSHAYRYPSLEVLADRAEYAVGDTAKLLVNTDVKDAHVLVGVEGRELHGVRVHHLFGQSGLVRVPIRAVYGANVFVSVHVRRGREVHSRVLELPIRSERHDLGITITPDRQEYRPQSQANVTIETRDAAGRPVAAEVALGVVDEALYALRADATPEMHDVFYGRQPNRVLTTVSFPTLYFAGADKSEGREPRRDFRDVALWAPAIRTGADGRGQATLRWPDNLTTWRFTARGASDATDVGQAVARARVSKDLVARLTVPRAFTAGDQATVVTVIGDRTGKPQVGVRERMKVAGAGQLTGPAERTTSLPALGESRSSWALRTDAESPRDGSDASVTLTFGATGAADADALELPVPVRPRAVPLALHGAGTLAEASQRVTVTLPADLVRSGSTLQLTLSPGAGGAVRAAADALLSYEYGCTEQTANALRATLALFAAGQKAGVAVPGAAAMRAQLLPRFQRLIALKRWDGAWGWWSGDDPDPAMTALAVDALAMCVQGDVQKDAAENALQEAAYGVQRAMSQVRDSDALAFATMHLARVAELPEARQRHADLLAQLDAVLTGLSAQRDRLGSTGSACAAVAAARLGRTAEARVLLDQTMGRTVRRGEALALPADPGAEDRWFGESDEGTAYALLALARIAPADARGDALVRSLLANRRGRMWRSTRVSGPVAVALAEWLAVHPEQLRPAGRVTATWNGAPVHGGTLGDAFGGGASVRLTGAQLQPGGNTLELTAEGSGTVHWAWEAAALVPSPGPATDAARLTVRREYLRATRIADRRGRPRWLAAPFDARQPLTVGDAVLVRLTFAAPRAWSHLLIEDPRPAGFEVDALLPEGAERPWGTAGEVRDDRAVFFLGQLPEGESVVEYLLRPELEGTFSALPTRAVGMYAPDLEARGTEARLVVLPRATRR